MQIKMDIRFQDLPGLDTSDYQLRLYVSAIAVAILASFLIWFIQPDPEAAEPISLPEPAPCDRNWHSDVLENPSIKVLNCFKLLEIPLTDFAVAIWFVRNSMLLPRDRRTPRSYKSCNDGRYRSCNRKGFRSSVSMGKNVFRN